MPDPQSPLRFAILYHGGIARPHYDVLIETAHDAPLLAFRSATWPISPDAVLERLPDHRRIYLEFEGPISGGRGHVSRIDEGTCTIDLNSADAFQVSLSPTRTPATSLHLTALRESKWRCTTK